MIDAFKPAVMDVYHNVTAPDVPPSDSSAGVPYTDLMEFAKSLPVDPVKVL
jgi:hypothetical protein